MTAKEPSPIKIMVDHIRMLQSEMSRAKAQHKGEMTVDRDLYLDLLDSKIDEVIETLEMITASGTT